MNVEKLVDPRARHLVQYRDAVYAGIQSDTSKAGGRRKFLPVILDVDRYGSREKDCVPLLFQAGTVFRLHKEDVRRFDFDNESRHFERLICHMAGINRMELAKIPQVSHVPILPDPFGPSE